MTPETGTLQELQVKPGDVVEFGSRGYALTITRWMTNNNFPGLRKDEPSWRIVSRAAEPTGTQSPRATSQDARRMVAMAVKRGREYTAGDLSTLTGLSVPQARMGAAILAEMGILKRDMIPKEGVTVFALNTSPAVHGDAPSAD